MSDDQIREYITRARRIAEPVGPMHSYWGIIYDADEILKGKPSTRSREEVETEFKWLFPSQETK